ncbi:MAG TPA: hypothetical protein VKX45_07425 [Bryobacteraceae bacterium]|nr:hypothetical protein [Bryobacteraceae bacterium]
MDLKLRRIRVTSIIGVASAVLILAFGWRTWIDSKNVAAENASLREALGRPVIIRDFELDILPYMVPVRPVTLPQPSNTEKVILVAKQTCPYCAKQLPIWKDLAASSVLDKDAEFWLISLGEADAFHDLTQTLAARGRSYREFRVPDVALFGLCTGIRGTPTTIVTSGNRVTLVYAGLFTEPIRKQVFSGAVLKSSARVRFPSPGLTEAVQ